MMVAMGHGLCVSFWVSGEMTINKVGPKKLQCNLELPYLLIALIAGFRKKSTLIQSLNFDRI